MRNSKLSPKLQNINMLKVLFTIVIVIIIIVIIIIIIIIIIIVTFIILKRSQWSLLLPQPKKFFFNVLQKNVELYICKAISLKNDSIGNYVSKQASH